MPQQPYPQQQEPGAYAYGYPPPPFPEQQRRQGSGPGIAQVTPDRSNADERVVSADLEDWISGLAGGEPSVRRLRKRLEATLDGSLVARTSRSRDGDRPDAPADHRRSDHVVPG